MYIHKEIISVAILILLIALFIIIKFLFDFNRLSKIIKELSKEELSAEDFFFFNQFEPVIYNLNNIVKKYEEKLKFSRLQILFYDKFFNSFPDPLFIIDDKNYIVELNSESKKLVGDKAKGQNINSILRIPNLGSLIQSSISSRKPQKASLNLVFPMEIVYDVWVSGSSKVGENKLNFIRLYDSTSEKKNQEIQTEFIANVSHELKTPISAIQGYCETLLGVGKNDEDVRVKFLKILKKESSRMNSLVNDLLSLTRIERIEHSPPDTFINLIDILKESIEIVAKSSGIDERNIIGHSFSKKSIIIWGEYDELKQVFINIIDNAIKYGISKTLPKIIIKEEKDYVNVIIKDFGKGVEPQKIPMLTNRFFRADVARSRDLGSTGLGLSIVKHILNRHKTELIIDSKINEGSSFSVKLKKNSSVVLIQQ